MGPTYIEISNGYPCFLFVFQNLIAFGCPPFLSYTLHPFNVSSSPFDMFVWPSQLESIYRREKISSSLVTSWDFTSPASPFDPTSLAFDGRWPERKCLAHSWCSINICWKNDSVKNFDQSHNTEWVLLCSHSKSHKLRGSQGWGKLASDILPMKTVANGRLKAPSKGAGGKVSPMLIDNHSNNKHYVVNPMCTSPVALCVKTQSSHQKFYEVSTIIIFITILQTRTRKCLKLCAQVHMAT